MDRKRSTLMPILVAVLVCVAGFGGRAQLPAQDQGATGAWQKIRKLQTTASAMHTTAHPDDEHGGMLALLSRGKGSYTYFAYAFHRQLPYGVPGAYRLLANLLSINR